jgi:large subunit ribosomal protein L16
MLLSPKKVKFRKQRKGKGQLNVLRGQRKSIHKASAAYTLDIGDYGLKAMEPGRLTAAQIEAARRVMMRKMKSSAAIKNQGKLLVRIFPDIPVTKKPTEVRMGKGKGSLSFWSTKVLSGRILFEFDGITKELAMELAHSGNAKLPLATKLIFRRALVE